MTPPPDRAIEIGVGLLGPAGIGQAHAHAYTLVRQVLWPPAAVPRLVRVCGRQTAKAEGTRARYGFERAGDRWQDLVSDPAVEVLDNCAPNHLHLEPCLAAITSWDTSSVQSARASPWRRSARPSRTVTSVPSCAMRSWKRPAPAGGSRWQLERLG